MAAGFFAVFDDIAALLDDTAAMSKIATKKTASVLSDDLAVNAEKASGFASSRELPVLWAISKGSLRNKMVILPIAFMLSAFASWLIVPILILGGLYLAFEGVEKVFEYFFPHPHAKESLELLSQEEILKLEGQKIRSAIVTDFILSIEIIIIALGTVVDKALPIQIFVVSFVAVLATIGVYGLVALLVRMDDMGFRLIEIASDRHQLLKAFGELLVRALPKVIKFLTIIGTLAMLLVAGGIFVHHIHPIDLLLEPLPELLAQLTAGSVIGTLALLLEKLFMRVKACALKPKTK